MVRAFRWAVFRDVVGACRPPAERRGGGRAARSPERARHERLRLRLAHGIRTTLEDGALCARRTGGVTPNANPSLAGIRPPQQLSGAKLPLAALPGRVGPLSGKQGVGLRVAHLADAQRDVAGVTTRIVGKNLESRKTGPSDAARALSATGAEHAWLIQGIDDVLDQVLWRDKLWPGSVRRRRLGRRLALRGRPPGYEHPTITVVKVAQV